MRIPIGHPDRLTTLGNLLLADANNPKGAKFDLGLWLAPSEAVDDGWTAPQLGLNPDDKSWMVNPIEQAYVPKMSCGTTACAMGLALASGAFAQFGLEATYYTRSGGALIILPKCNGQDGFGAAAELFGITEEDAQYLFDPDQYTNTPREAEGEREVAERIFAFINGDIDEDQHPNYAGNGYGDSED